MNTGQESINDLVEILRLEGESEAHIRNLLLYLMGEEHGVPDILGRDQYQQARALENRYRLTGGSFGRSSLTRQLDFDQGVEIVA